MISREVATSLTEVRLLFLEVLAARLLPEWDIYELLILA